MTTSEREAAYRKCYPEFMALDAQKVTFLRQSLNSAIANAQSLTQTAETDQDVLVAAGIDPLVLASLRDRMNAFIYAAHRYQDLTNVDPVALAKWNDTAPKGYEVRGYLIRFLSYAFRNDQQLLKTVDDRILQGREHQDMIEDLQVLSLLAENNATLVRQVPTFDEQKIKEAMALHITLNRLHQKASIDVPKATEAKNILNRAYTWYNIAANEVKILGQYLFQGTGRVLDYGFDSHSRSSHIPKFSYKKQHVAVLSPSFLPSTTPKPKN